MDGQAAYEQVQNAPHKAKLSHEVVSAAAGFLAMKAYNDHQKKNGKPQSHAAAKQLLAGFGAAFVDRLVESKGLDAIDAHKAKKEAEAQAQQQYDQSYQ